MPIASSDIKFYYTTGTNGAAQTEPSLSIGGYPSTTEVVFTALFDRRVGDNLTQYRCVAVTNAHATAYAYSSSFFLKALSANPSTTIAISVEQPLADTLTGTTTGGSVNTLIDTSLGTTYNSNVFVNCYLTVLSGININLSSKIISYDKPTNTFVFSPSLGSAIVSGVQYRIDPSPSARMTDVLGSPLDSTLRTSFSSPSTAASAISVNVFSRSHGAHIRPHDVAYVWFKRTLTKNTVAYLNSATLSMRYSTT